MSCNIYDVWHFKETVSLKDMVALAQQISGAFPTIWGE